MTGLKIDHMNLLVTSLEVSMPYYDTLLPLLGYTKEREHIWYDGNGFYFQFLAAEEGTRPYERFGAGMSHLGFAAPDLETVEQVRARMSEAGFAVPDLQEFGGVTALFMKDPDGVRFEVAHYPPGTSAVG